MKKKLSIVLAVILTLTLSLPSVTVAILPDNTLEPMNCYSVSGHNCGPSSGVSIGRYYRDRNEYYYGNNYPYLPDDDDDMYDALYEYMNTGIFGNTSPYNYGPGFVEMALHYGYDNFSYDIYDPVTADDYDDVIVNAIDNGWPVALFAMGVLAGFQDVDALPESDEDGSWPPLIWHVIAIKGYYRWWYGYDHVVVCTDNYSNADNLYLDWDQLCAEVGENLVAVIIKDVDPDGDGPCVEDFEWGSDGASLDTSGGEVEWDISTSGASVVEIDTAQAHTGTRSARFYRNLAGPYAWYSLLQPSYIGFYVRKGDTAYAGVRNGDGNRAIYVEITDAEELGYRGSDGYHTLYYTFPVDDWVLVEFRNIDWEAGTYDIYVDGVEFGATMRNISLWEGKLYFASWAGDSGEFWIDDITDSLAKPRATTLELLPEADSNPVDTTHDITATVYDQFGYEMEGVAVTWSISGVGSFSGTPEGVTDADGQAAAVITSSVPGTSTVRCEVTGNPSVYDTATKDWTYHPCRLRPNAAGDVTQLSPKGAAPNWNCVDEPGDGDGDTTYVTHLTSANWRYDLYNLPDHTTESGSINKVTVFIRHRKYGPRTEARGRTVIKTGGTEYRGATMDPGYEYTLHYTEYTTNPKTGNDWTWAEIDALQAGFDGYAYIGSLFPSYPRCTQVCVEVDYTPFPEATTLELLPETDSNPVDTTHNLTATVYDQFDYEMAGVAVTWTIESGPGSFVSQDTTTDADGEADAQITSSVPRTSTVRCEVTGNPSVYDTATKDWTYTCRLRPNAGNVTQLSPAGAAPNWDCVDEPGDGDGDTTFVTHLTSANWRYDLYNLPDHTTESGSISKVTVFIRHRRYGPRTEARGRTVIKTGEVEHRGDIMDPGCEYILHYTEYTKNPETDDPWTWAEIDALQAGFDGYAYIGALFPSYPRCTQVWVEVDYIPFSEATTLELSPETDSNPVDTTHDFTATVRDQFNNVMAGVAVTWTIESGPGSFVSQDTTTDADGEADAVITSSVLGASMVRCEVTGSPSVYDTATKDWTYLEDFEWGNDGDSLDKYAEYPELRGFVEWTVSSDGSSVAEIDTAQAHSGTKSGRFYYDGSSDDILAYYSQDSPTWRGFYLRKDKNAVPYTITGNETNAVVTRVTRNEWLQYYDGSWQGVCKISADTWYFIEFRNIDWVAATYDIYVDNHLENSDTPMSASTSYNGITAYYGSHYESEFWIDDILK